MYRLGLAILLSGVFAACTTTDSSLIDTDDIWADFEVEATGNGESDVYATLRVHSASSSETADVGNGDELSATMSSGAISSTKVMEEAILFGVALYSANFDNDNGGVDYKVDFDRSGSGKVDAPDSTAVLPQAMSIEKVTRVADGPAVTEFSRSTETIYVDWSPYGETDTMAYAIEGSCINSQTAGITGGDTGRLMIPAGSILPLSGQEAQPCQLTITLTRTRNGSVDPAFGGGTFAGVQRRETTINSIQ